ncbi:MAG: K(+)-transporting ATPase subunit F [Paenibacillaceae bacterium]|nr:K(+)-transporting ATPase subunit F [Paenibacillaceae bacterium]
MRKNGGGDGGRTVMTIVWIVTFALLLYLIYALLHPEKF